MDLEKDSMDLKKETEEITRKVTEVINDDMLVELDMTEPDLMDIMMGRCPPGSDSI